VTQNDASQGNLHGSSRSARRSYCAPKRLGLSSLARRHGILAVHEPRPWLAMAIAPPWGSLLFAQAPPRNIFLGMVVPVPETRPRKVTAQLPPRKASSARVGVPPVRQWVPDQSLQRVSSLARVVALLGTPSSMVLPRLPTLSVQSPLKLLSQAKVVAPPGTPSGAGLSRLPTQTVHSQLVRLARPHGQPSSEVLLGSLVRLEQQPV